MDWHYLLTNFSGRISRQPFWMGTIAVVFAAVVLNFVIAVLFGRGMIGSLLAFLLILALVFPLFAVLTKRFHDREKSGWWSLIALLPVIGQIWIIVECGLLAGTPGPNQYGPDPLGAPAHGLT